MNFGWLETFCIVLGVVAVIVSLGWAMSWSAYQRKARSWRGRVQTLTQQLAKADASQKALGGQVAALRRELEEKRALVTSLQPPRAQIPPAVAGVKQMNEIFLVPRRPVGNTDFEETQIL